MPMPSLLSLPRELRDHIIEYVILSCSDPPQSPAQDTCKREEATDACALRPAILPQHVYSAYGLLLANHQLNAEVCNRLDKNHASYSLDVMIVENELWPSWTCCPSRASGTIDAINITLRFFTDTDDPFVVHVARTCRAILRGRNWTATSMHPLSEIFLHTLQVCLRSTNSKNAEKKTRLVHMDIQTFPHFENLSGLVGQRSVSTNALKAMFGKHRSLWNQFRSIQSYIGREIAIGEWSFASTLRLMVLLKLEDKWAEEASKYNQHMGVTGAAFRRVQKVLFTVDGRSIEDLAADPSLG
jgi:hypothetical protein